MFEKEAEEIANKKLCSEWICYNKCNFNSPKHHRCGEWHRCYESAKDGAEVGYDKANEWHYSSKGEYQKVKEENEQLKAQFEKLINLASHYISECDVCELYENCKENDWCCPNQTKDIKELIREYVSRS